GHQQDDVGVIRIDPQVLVIVAARCSADALPRLSAIAGLHGHNTGAIYHVWILGIDFDHREVAAADLHRRLSIIGDFRPCLATVGGAVDAALLVRPVGMA